MKTTVDFGSRVFTIEVVEKLALEDDARDAQGTINSQKCLIRVEKRMDDQTKMLVIWHEIIHQLLDRANHDGSEFINPKMEEPIIENLADGIMLVLRLNPWLGDIK